MLQKHIYRDTILLLLGFLLSILVHESCHFISALYFGDTPSFDIYFGLFPTLVVRTYLVGNSYYMVAFLGPFLASIIMMLFSWKCWGMKFGAIFQMLYVPMEMFDVLVRHYIISIEYLINYSMILIIGTLISLILLIYRRWLR